MIDLRFDRRMTARLAAAAMLVAMLGCAGVTTVHQHPEFAQSRRPVRSIAVMPPDVTRVQYNLIEANHRDAEGERQIADAVAGVARSSLAGKGYAVAATSGDPGDGGRFDALYARFKSAHQVVAKALLRRPEVFIEESTSLQVGVGLAAAELASDAQADAVMYLRIRDFARSGVGKAAHTTGEILVTVLPTIVAAAAPVTGPAASAVYHLPSAGYATYEAMQSDDTTRLLQITLIEGRTGDALWSNTKVLPDKARAIPDWEALTTLALESFPSASASSGPRGAGQGARSAAGPAP